MGRRRKRSNSDNDESLEQTYNKSQSHHRSDVNGNDDSSAGEKASEKRAKVSSEKMIVEESSPSNKPIVLSESLTKHDVSEKEKQRIERLQKNKKRRKEQKQAKALAKQETTAERSNMLNSSKASDKKPSKDKADNSNVEFQALAKGVQYRDVVVGKGPFVQERKKIRVTYTLRAAHRYGKILDSSNDFKFRIGRGEVVKGWDIGIMGMRQGGKRYLIIPPNAGYGGRDVGAGRGGILFFEVTVLEC